MALKLGFLIPLLHIIGLSSGFVIKSDCPQIVTREEWGARPPTGQIDLLTLPVPYFTIHHTEMGNCTTEESCIADMQEIQDFHIDDRGWFDIGYNFLIGGDGRVYEGRGWTQVGAHAANYNTRAIGVALIGNFMNELPKSRQLLKAKEMILCAVENGSISSDYQLFGHRDMGNTDCPGNALYELISTWPKKGDPFAIE